MMIIKNFKTGGFDMIDVSSFPNKMEKCLRVFIPFFYCPTIRLLILQIFGRKKNIIGMK